MRRALAAGMATFFLAAGAGASLAYGAADAGALRAQLARERSAWHHERAALRRVKAPTIRTAARIAQATYGVPVRGLMALAWCESRHDPGARNPIALADGSHASGFTQIATPGTWSWTPYRALSPFDITANVMAAGWIWRYRGGSFSEWADICVAAGEGAS